ncbi:MAG TPA: mannosyltransferase family protein [Acidimicrobiales bacterium]|nr:mannosyltransferase family protein [Acidimicrobiales bacterium]
MAQTSRAYHDHPQSAERPRREPGAGATGWVRSCMPAVRESLAAVWLPWVIARVVTLLALALAKFEVRTLRITEPKAVQSAHQGLLTADAAWYRLIAMHGYGTPRTSLRFFPLMPLVTRGVTDVTHLPTGAALLVVSNVCALGATMLVYGLARHELRDVASARRAAWIFSLVPPAFVLVMGYSESLFILLAAAAFLCLRRRLWAWSALWGFLAGACRPIGFLLAIPAVIEGARGWRGPDRRSKGTRAVAVLAPIAGCLAYLAWAGAVFGDFFAPFRLQHQGEPPSVSADPLVNLYRDARDALTGAHLGSGLHLPWILLGLTLSAVALARLPSSFGVYSLGVVLVASVTAINFESFERYALSAFPLWIAASTLTKSPRVMVTVVAVSSVGLFAYALLAFLGAYVP